MSNRIYFNRFYSKINGRNIYDYTKLDVSLKTLEERLEYVDKLLNLIRDEYGIEFSDDEFWNEVFVQRPNKTSYIDLMPNNDTELYSDSNIAKTLEMIANYILWCDPDKNKKENIKIFNDEKKFQDALSKDRKYFDKYGQEVDGGVIILRRKDNYKKAKDEKVTAEDLKKHPELRAYKKEIDRLSAYIKEDRLDEFVEYMQNKGHVKIKNEKQAKSFLINHIGLLKKDMLQAKIDLVRPIVWKAPLKDEGEADWNELDELDPSHMKALLQLYRESEVYDFQSDLGCIFSDLKDALNEVKLTEKQQELLSMWMKGMTVTKIAEELNVTGGTISRNLNKVVDNIIKVYELKLEDWYYLNICKGEYKQCKKCGEVKLINKFYKESNGGYKTKCKKCMN